MVVYLGIASVLGGTVLACLAERSRGRAAHIEATGGICFIAGLAAIGGSLPFLS